MPRSEEAKQKQRQRNREWKQRNADKHLANVRAYRERYPERLRAYRMVQYAIKTGRLIRGPCRDCGTTTDVHAHHGDYSKPLDVTWLCRSCHNKHHEPDVMRGALASPAKLTETQVRRVRKLLASGVVSEEEIARLFDVTQGAISAIRRGISWAHVEDGLTFQVLRGRPPVPSDTQNRVRELLAAGLTQSDIAKQVHISTASVSRILNDRKGS